MKIKSKWIVFVTVGMAVFLLIGWRPLQSWLLTWTHEAELRPPVQKYLEVIGTVEGWNDAKVKSQVATGNRLADLLQLQCTDCARLEVTTGVQIRALEVLAYSAEKSKVRVQYEGGSHFVEPRTLAVIGQCNVRVDTTVLIMELERNVWKVEDEQDFHPDVIPDEEYTRLRAKYCTSR